MVLERVQKIIANNSTISRRKAESLINSGKVSVNNITITLGDKADLQKDEIRINGEKLIIRKEFVYLAIYKPKGYMTTVSDPYAEKTVVDLLPKKYQDVGVYPVGRLDIDAEGLLFCTNDGNFSQKILHPSYELPKTYRVWLDKPILKRVLERMALGVKLKDTYVKDIQVRKVTNSCVEITIHVGLHKVVKRIFAEYEFRVLRLVRTNIGTQSLGSLKVGECKLLSSRFVEKIKKM